MADRVGMTTITITRAHGIQLGDTISINLEEHRVWKWVVAFIFRLPKPIKTELFTVGGMSETTLDVKKYHWWNRYVH